MSRREGLRLLAAGVLTVWLCLFLHWENTEKSMIRALLVETKDDSWTVGLLYQFPEASADSSEAEAAIRLCVGRGPQLSAAIAAAEKALPQRADWRLCEYLFVEQDSVRRALREAGVPDVRGGLFGGDAGRAGRGVGCPARKSPAMRQKFRSFRAPAV